MDHFDIPRGDAHYDRVTPRAEVLDAVLSMKEQYPAFGPERIAAMPDLRRLGAGRDEILSAYWTI